MRSNAHRRTAKPKHTFPPTQIFCILCQKHQRVALSQFPGAGFLCEHPKKLDEPQGMRCSFSCNLLALLVTRPCSRCQFAEHNSQQPALSKEVSPRRCDIPLDQNTFWSCFYTNYRSAFARMQKNCAGDRVDNSQFGRTSQIRARLQPHYWRHASRGHAGT